MKIKRYRKWFGLVACAVTIAVVGVISGVHVEVGDEFGGEAGFRIGLGDSQYVTLIIGPESLSASPAVDYTCDGVADDVQFQAAMDALPPVGGQLFVLAGTYQWTPATTVSRAIDNITIEGVGLASDLNCDAGTPLFSAGVRTNWVFRNFQTDAGGVDVSTALEYTLENVQQGATYMGHYVPGDVTLSAGSLLTAATGRAATFTVAAVNASSLVRAQADYLCDGVADEVQINAALAALPADEGKVQLSKGDFTCAATINMLDAQTLAGQGFTATTLTFPSLGTDYIGVNIGGALGIGGAIIDLWITGPAANALDVGIRVNAVQSFLIFNCRIGTIATGVIFQEGSHFGFLLESEVLGYVDAVLVGPAGASCNAVRIVDCAITHRGGNGIRGVIAAQLIIAENYFESAAVIVATGDSINLENTCDRAHILNNYSDTGAAHVESFIEFGATSNNHYVAGNCHFGDCSGNVIHSPSAYNIFIGNAITNGAGAGIFIEGGGQIMNNWFQANGTRAIDASTGQREVQIIGNTIKTSGSEGIYLYAWTDSSATVIGNFIANTQTHGIYVKGRGAVVTGNSVMNCNVAAGLAYGIFIDGLVYGVITDNHVSGALHDYGINEAGASNNNIIANNVLNNNIAPLAKVGAATIVRDNIGYVTENFGTATLLNANTSIIVAHGCSATPTVILITFMENPDNLMADWWVDTVGAANFTFNGVDPGASNLDFYWEAKVR